MAAANGGRESDWTTLDDLLEDPGILVGSYPVESCQQGVHALEGMDATG